MRWYCLHPELPETAVLRIRSAPNSGASVCGRVSKGKAIAALAPEFEIANDTLSLSATNESAGAPQRWLHVSFPDEVTGEDMTEGYVMASLPDGMRLLVPWEQAGFINCCRIVDASAKLFDGPSKTANAVGLAEEGEGLKYPYGVVAVEGSRACMVHDVLESVWVEIAELEPVCVHVRHPNCSSESLALVSLPCNFHENNSVVRTDFRTILCCAFAAPHAFYTLNEDLPPEAQIAIRSFPSKDAETVGLLSRGEVIEVVAQCENWLQVADAHGEEEEEEESWIMWQTDSWTLLVELLGYSSEKCARQESFSDRVAEAGTTSHHDQGATSGQPPAADSIAHSPEEGSMSAPDSSVSSPQLGAAETTDLIEDPSSRDEMERLNDSFHDREFLNGAGAATDGDRVDKEDVEENRDVAFEAHAVASSSWDDRPLNVRSSRGNDVSNSDEFEQDDQVSQNRHLSPEEGGSNESVIQRSSDTPREYWDDRPIRPQKQSEMNWDEGLPPARDPDEVQLIDDEKEAHEEAAGDEDRVADLSIASDRTASSESTSAESGVAWDETPVGGGKSRPWDETPVGVQSHPVAITVAEEEASREPMSLDDATDETDGKAVRTETVLSWDEMPVGGSGHRSWDETPVGGGNPRSWDETPVGVQNQPTTTGEEIEAVQSQLMVADATAEGNGVEEQPETVSSWDETPLSASSHDSSADVHDTMSVPEPMSVDDVDGKEEDDRMVLHEETFGGGSSRQWDETPVSIQSSGDAEDVEVRTETMSENVTEGRGEDQVVTTERVSSWDDTPVGGNRRHVWDETPVGGGSSHPWDEFPVGARVPEDLGEEEEGEDAQSFALPEPVTQTLDNRPAGSSLARLLERDLASSDQAFDSEPSSSFAGDHDLKGKLTLADLDELVEPVRDEMPVGVTRSQSPLRSHEHTPVESLNETAQGGDGDIVMNEEIAGLGPSGVPPSGSWDQDTRSRTIVPHDDIFVRSDQMSEELPGSSGSNLAEEDGQAVAEEMAVDLPETVEIELRDANQPSPEWNETPVGPASLSDEDEEHFYASQDADQQLPDIMQVASDGDPSAFTEVAQSVTKRGAVFSGTKSRVENRSSVGGPGFAGRRTRKPRFSHSDNGNGGLSFLMEFGIRAYCRHKQILITSNEEVSQILFEAVVYGDDPEVILEALTADEPPCEDWMTFSPSKVRVVSSEADAHNFLDVLYARDSGEIPSTPRQVTPQHIQQQLRTPPHSSGARKAKIDRMFNRTPVKQRSTPTYDLIMSNADVDKILEAEFGNEACELSILGPYKYPTLAGSQMAGKPSGSPVGNFGAVHSSSSRFPVTTFQTAPSKDFESKASIAPGHRLRSEEDLPPRFSTPPPTEENANPLKRAASAIAKTPPVQITKTASAPSVVSAAIEAAPKPASTTLPSASRLGARPSSTSSLLGASSVLRRPSPQPTGSVATSRSAADPALPRPRSSLTSEPSATAGRSSITGALPKPGQPFLRRKSFLPTPSPGKSTATTQSANRNSIAGSIAQATDTSSLQARRTSFGFVRPKTTTTSSSTIPKK